ncbi:sensor histidine kinase [Phormidium sp. CCY1219]|uniref:sensor histidine kinase n=1 Tax=Phormidium sp. CCY1219 TaxID=2886104 RepID=UPI002D1F5250|nr:ATP-binding protein [Phormidium sp. CCY1219]MEB3826872.1 HAMP domain-containing protein [Phormidium sp. CCY1219]
MLPPQLIDFNKPSFKWMRRLMPSLSIAKKIGFGYSVAIGIGVLGTAVGLAIGDFYQKQAGKELAIAYEQQYLLSELENSVLKMRSHPQRLVTVFGDSIWFEYETAKFSADVTRIHELLGQLSDFQERKSTNLAVDTLGFESFLQEYKTATDAYANLIQSIWKDIDPPRLTQEEIPAAQQQLLTANSSDRANQLTVKFEQLSEQLSRLISAAKTQQLQANFKLDRAESLRLQIIIASMVLSAAIAVLVGLYTSRAIARPIRWVSEVAQQVTQRANFNLVAPVLTDDEVGALATSLNQMIRWMGEYTHQLELSRDNLEKRVEERTRELRDALEELKQTQAQLIQSEKMSSLGQMVAGLAHEINNPVNFIYGNIEHTRGYMEDLLELVNLYEQEYPHPTAPIQAEIDDIELDFLREDLPKILASMKLGTDRIRQIILSLRNFSRLDESYIKPVDIHEGLESTLLILNNRLKKDIEVVKSYKNLPLVHCYPAQLNQVFMNLLSNAIDALQEQPDIPDRKIIISTESLDSNRIRIRICDTGPGIPREIQGQLFDPFFTTKPVGKGTGLGLAICYQIIAKHQGKIEVNSQPGQGTEFAIVLPIQPPQTVKIRKVA